MLKYRNIIVQVSNNIRCVIAAMNMISIDMSQKIQITLALDFTW